MAEPFLGEIVMFGGTFAPRSWANCDGQILPINTNQALFSILGTTYGGDGRTTFGLPDLRGRNPVHAGSGPGLNTVTRGQKFGANSVTLTVANLANHTHTYTPNVNTDPGNNPDPSGGYYANGGAALNYHSASDANMGQSETLNAGNNVAMSVTQPFIGLRYIIATQGIFPSRS